MAAGADEGAPTESDSRLDRYASFTRRRRHCLTVVSRLAFKARKAGEGDDPRPRAEFACGCHRVLHLTPGADEDQVERCALSHENIATARNSFAFGRGRAGKHGDHLACECQDGWTFRVLDRSEPCAGRLLWIGGAKHIEAGWCQWNAATYIFNASEAGDSILMSGSMIDPVSEANPAARTSEVATPTPILSDADSPSSTSSSGPATAKGPTA